MFKNSKKIFIFGFCILVIIAFLFATIMYKDNYYLEIKNNSKKLNTSLLNNIAIANEEIKDETEEKKEKIEDKKNVIEVKSNPKREEQQVEVVKPASTVVDVPQQPVQTEQISGVYVGLKFTGSMTAYGKDCCGSDPTRWGITSSGYDLKQSLTYNDPTYGNVKIVASDRNFKLYSIIKVDDPIDGSYNAIILDRAGSAIGLNKTKKFDLAVESESYASSNYGVHKNITFEVLRVGK